MAINFDTIPQGIKVPGFYPEVKSRDGVFSNVSKTLIVALTVNTVAEEPVRVTSVDQAKALFGAGSQAHLMVKAYKANDTTSELWVYPLNNAAATAATGTVTIAGTPTAAGTIYLYIDGQLVQVSVVTTDTPTTIAGKVVTAVNANADLPVTASNAAGVVTLTAKNKGTIGNDIDVRVNHWVENGFEALPAGVTATVVAMASGATDPTLTSMFATIAPNQYDWFVVGLKDTTNMNTVQTNLNTRWLYNVKQYGHAVFAVRDTVSALLTLGAARNNSHETVIAGTGIINHPSQLSAAVTGALAIAFSADPSANTNTVAVLGLTQPKSTSLLSWSDHQNLLSSGIMTLYFNGNNARVQRAITTSKTNAAGFPDDSYYELRTLIMAQYYLEQSESLVTNKFVRAKLAADGTAFGSSNVVTPALVKAEFVAMYEDMIDQGICQNLDGFIKYSLFELDPNDPNRLNVKVALTFTNALYVTALQLSFGFKG